MPLTYRDIDPVVNPENPGVLIDAIDDSSFEALMRDMTENKETDLEKARLKLEKNPRWVLLWDGGKPVFVLNKYGSADKLSVLVSAIRDYKSRLKQTFSDINLYMDEVAKQKNSISSLVSLQAEVLTERKAKKPEKKDKKQ